MSLPQSILPKILKPRYDNVYCVVMDRCFMILLALLCLISLLPVNRVAEHTMCVDLDP